MNDEKRKQSFYLYPEFNKTIFTNFCRLGHSYGLVTCRKTTQIYRIFINILYESMNGIIKENQQKKERKGNFGLNEKENEMQ